ncbi:Lrp/AsnC family transcriptional regulator [Komagataeibacter medellinensis]|uniref:Transcriptional regulator AsnC family n=1 Tax=Komagataeibacter medellinensis (strain NBRC 3288 / BCRC 11682 / LMG 1693 / Kondo 51) TaxID=634177 RepID=G2I284_KOMMN|nr:winged helix-turn-helix transcriptional regulator [Komagataeibacter medellinensis]BAK82500.1 transcriptional regulator AsnC family [Komagataeibacter medellinensis NBRC 3288]
MTDNRFDLDGTSRQILRELQKNASLTNQELSERVGISPSPAGGGYRNCAVRA